MRASRGIAVVSMAALVATCWSSAAMGVEPTFTTAAGVDSGVKRGGCPDATILVSILTDNFPGETTWEVTDHGTGAVIASGGPLVDANTLHEIPVCVDSTGCFDFTIFDAFGDGICCGFGAG
ncbi:MAG: hypothetical protein IID43_03795, partial [Planctomycetes bacterium]|nr:hypothetical protein [Planctomycetota bacterium]